MRKSRITHALLDQFPEYISYYLLKVKYISKEIMSVPGS